MSGDIEILVDTVLNRNVAGSSLESVRKFLSVPICSLGGRWLVEIGRMRQQLLQYRDHSPTSGKRMFKTWTNK